VPTEILGTLADAAVTLAGFAALVVFLPQLAGTEWRPGMTTGLWLMITLCFGAFVFSVLPLILAEIGAPDGVAIAASSGLLSVFILLSGGLAGRRDRRLVKEGIAAPPPAPIVANATFGLAVVLMLLANALDVLPGSAGGWYVVGILSLLVMAAVPLGFFFYVLDRRK
jgi:hypothetical protein